MKKAQYARKTAKRKAPPTGTEEEQDDTAGENSEATEDMNPSLSAKRPIRPLL